MEEQLPPDIVDILEGLAIMAKGYDNYLKWNEEAMLKADLMNNRRYWKGFPAKAVRDKCLELGMRGEDADRIFDYVSRAQAGRRLIPDRGYKDHRFKHERDEPTEQPFPSADNPLYPHSEKW